MSDFDEVTAKLKQTRDELKLQLHLAGKEAEEEWDDLVKDWDKFVQQKQLNKSADEVGEAAKQLGLRMKDAFDRLRKS
ncbi:hypothetical protein [Antarcticimicrobium sediminis]|uniref:Uncharacterized protein n=1 Tax=Antarcticimicrobium sediminis TaxID=2546227 RepID=A0A4R5EU39_9RHOB|nr:hypothetical protein [Antarcticimicrobium sediminis]TDE38300.1 hypothetical protein E1B25_09235 [Antarcticimicrobium sediminis]